MVQNMTCRGASLFCIFFSCFHLCASKSTGSPLVAACDGHVAAETSVNAHRCRAPLHGLSRVLLQKSSSRVQLQTPEQGGKSNASNASIENSSSIAPVASLKALDVVVEDGHQESVQKTWASVFKGEEQVMMTSFLLQRAGVGLVLVALFVFVLSFVCLIVTCMKHPQEEMRETPENFDPWLSPRQVDGRKFYKVPRIPAPVDTSRLPALSSNRALSPRTLSSLPQFSPPFPSQPHLRQVNHPASVANSLGSMQVPASRLPIGRHSSVLSSHSVSQQRQSIESQHPMVLRPGSGSPPQWGGVMYEDSIASSSRLSLAPSPRFSTAAMTPRMSTTPPNTSPRFSTAAIAPRMSAMPRNTSPRMMQGPSSSTLATEQQVARWRAEIQARAAAATEEEVARRKIMARGGLLGGGGGGVDAAIARASSPNDGTHFITKLPMRARTTSPQNQPQHGLSRTASQQGIKGVSGLVGFFNTPRPGANIFDATCDAFQDL